jgi:hypothetical protein
VRVVVGQRVVSTAAGVAIGLVLTRAASRRVEPLSFEQPATEVLTYPAVAGTMILVELVACRISRQASCIDIRRALETISFEGSPERGTS